MKILSAFALFGFILSLSTSAMADDLIPHANCAHNPPGISCGE